MFQDCKEFDSDLSSWDVSNVINNTWMFAGCDKHTPEHIPNRTGTLVFESPIWTQPIPIVDFK